ncbi:hypothetical protein AB0878_44920 [Amycolatopsis sp. NPDC047767]|uniref:hypothetical protein n=1 Tax=Amycolatopsis sp. NPDC047767 TaxID=3156765 RepID=UPI003455EF8F
MINPSSDELMDLLAAFSTDEEGNPTSPMPPRWDAEGPDAMRAIKVGSTGIGLIDMSSTEPWPGIFDHLGDIPNPMRHFRTVEFRVGDNSIAAHPLNVGATRLLHRLLVDTRAEAFPATTDERRHATELLSRPETLPVIHGPCVITGADQDGEPVALDEDFRRWFEKVVEDLAEFRTALLAALARAINVPPEAFGGDSIIIL